LHPGSEYHQSQLGRLYVIHVQVLCSRIDSEKLATVRIHSLDMVILVHWPSV
jgi:hypothetical protein